MDHPPIRIAAPAAPGNNATVTLFDSTTMLPNIGMRSLGVQRVLISFPGLSHASATDGLKGYASADHGTTWRLDTFGPAGDPNLLPQTVATDDGSVVPGYDIDVSGVDDAKFTYTAGATGPTTWAPVIVLNFDRSPAS